MKASHLRFCLFLFGLASLCFLLGAAVIYFDLPPSSFIQRGFAGGAAWYEGRKTNQVADEDLPPLSVGQIYIADKACNGFTLCMFSSTRTVLVDMRGRVVHEWYVPFSRIWPDAPGGHPPNDAAVYFTGGHLYPNGDLLAVMEGPIDFKSSSNGYGLVKIDKDSNVIWKYRDKCHHDVDVGEDGTIYTITNEIVEKLPPGLEYIPAPSPCVIDVVDIISPEGKRLKRIPLLEAFRDSPAYAPYLCMLERSKMYGQASPPAPPGVTTTPIFDDRRRGDVFHTNTVKVLTTSKASKFPQFKAGQLLISPRHLDALAVLDPDSGKIVWAARGIWRAQHDPSFLDNGHILIFDNMGSPRGSRVLEYDPLAQSFPWWYPGDNGIPFYSRIRGMSQRLPNGNTLIVNSEGGEVFEVTPQHEVVWSGACGVELKRAQRFTADQLPFLKGEGSAPP